MPPIHPAIVHLPIAFVILSVLADLGARVSRNESRRAVLRTIGFWSLLAALAGAVLAVAAGYFDMRRAALTPETQAVVDLHMAIGWMLLIGIAVLSAWRWLIWHRGQMTIDTGYLAGGVVVLLLTLFQGWYGSEMVFAHGAGVAAAGQGTERPDRAQSRLFSLRDLLQPDTTAMGGAGDDSTNAPAADGEVRR
jgi:uncharacterized membrane protein